MNVLGVADLLLPELQPSRAGGDSSTIASAVILRRGSVFDVGWYTYPSICEASRCLMCLVACVSRQLLLTRSHPPSDQSNRAASTVSG